MNRKSIGVIAAAGLLAVAAVAPTSAQDGSRTVEIPNGEPVVIATFGVISGADAVLGQDWLNAVEVAVNDRGGMLLGHEILIAAQDGLCTVEGGAQAALAIASNPDVVGVIGSACSDETVGGIQAITEAGLTAISPSATRPALTIPERGPEFAGFLRTAHSDAFQGKGVAEFAVEQGFANVATIHDGSAYAEALVGVFETEFEALDGNITQSEAVSKGQTDMGPVLTSIAADNPDALYFPIFTAEGGFIVDQIRSIDGLEDIALIGSDGLFSVDFLNAAGPDVEGMFLSAPNFGLFQDSYADLVTKYQEHTGLENPLQAFHAHGYDAANMLFAAIESVAVENDDGSLSIDLGAVRAAVYATADFPGVTGFLTCSEFGDCGAPLIAVYQVDAATINGDNSITEAPVVWPPSP
jgi:branched-chain amino acid transport system substrate-binding protein